MASRIEVQERLRLTLEALKPEKVSNRNKKLLKHENKLRTPSQKVKGKVKIKGGSKPPVEWYTTSTHTGSECIEVTNKQDKYAQNQIQTRQGIFHEGKRLGR